MNTQQGSSSDYMKKYFEDDEFVEANVKEDETAYVSYEEDVLIKNLQNFEDLPLAKRVAHIRNMANIFECLDTKIMDFFDALIDDYREFSYDITAAWLAQIIPVAEILKNKFQTEESYSKIVTKICPFLSHLVLHKEADIRVLSRMRLGDIAVLLKEKDRDYIILPTCLTLLHSQNSPENQVAGLKLLGKLAPLFGLEFLEGFVTAELCAMSNEDQKNVRSESIIQMAAISPLIAQEKLENRLLPEFGRLSSDPAWEVRRAFVENIEGFAKLFPIEIRSRELSALLLKLIEDDSWWVQVPALKSLGKFMVLLDPKNIREEILSTFVRLPSILQKMNRNPSSSRSDTQDILIVAVKSIPDILKALGPKSWELIHILFKKLVEWDGPIKVQVAKIMHLIAQNVERRVLEGYLLKVMAQNLLKSTLTVKTEAMIALPMFMQALQVEQRETMVDVYLSLQDQSYNWRIRKIIANQISELSNLFTYKSFMVIILPMFFSFCSDKVSAVRDTACSQVVELVRAKIGEEDCLDMIFKKIRAFASFQRFTWRQSYLLMCESLVKEEDIFRKEFMDIFYDLLLDEVVNVRITGAKIMQRMIEGEVYLSQEPRFEELRKTLLKDGSQDVRMLLGGPRVLVEDVDAASEDAQSAKGSNSAHNEDNLSSIGEPAEEIENDFEELAKREEVSILDGEGDDTITDNKGGVLENFMENYKGVGEEDTEEKEGEDESRDEDSEI